MSEVRCRSSRVCAGLHSAPVSRSLTSKIGAVSVAVVIFSFSPCRGMSQMRLSSFGILRRRGGLRFRRRFENRLKQAKKIAHLRLGEDEWRQQAQGEIAGGV